MKRASHGCWPSPLTSDVVAAAALRLSQPQLAAGRAFWLEGRPLEGGRQVVMRASLSAGGGAPEPAVPEGWSVRSHVHEYGGGDYRATPEALFVVSADGGVFRWPETGAPSAVVGTRPGARYGDLAASPDGRWLLAVEEEAGAGAGPENRLVALAIAGRERRVLDDAHDFVSSPVFAPRGDRIAWLTWDHPDMPWDATTLYEQAFGARGPAGPPRRVAGGGEESIFQPSYAPDGTLTFVSDRSGWWNLHQLREGRVEALLAREAEFGLPQWALGMTTHAHAGAGRILCVERSGGFDRLGMLDVARRRLDPLALPYDEWTGVACDGRHALLVGAGCARPPAVVRLDLASGAFHELRRGFEPPPGCEGLWSVPEPVSFAGAGDGHVAHAFLYRPRSATHQGPEGERAPLLVKSHGGPTGAASPALKLATQYWTSRGFALVDVDYAGSSGYGRAYRNLLRGGWGERDVDDCCAAARHAVGEGVADPRRLLASGSSAGGYTTLCLLTFRDLFAAGASYYGIGDLEALARDTHKFEAHYLDRLVGPWPACAERYRARSPAHHPERLVRPVIFFQGLEDRVVPPAQAEALVAALRRRGVRHAYVAFPGEGHGFRRAENLARALEEERSFYSEVLGFPGSTAPASGRVESAGRG